MNNLQKKLRNIKLLFTRPLKNFISIWYYPQILYYYFRGTDHLIKFYKKINILSSKETLDYIINKNISFVRFGTGEAHVAMGMEQNGGHTIQKAKLKLTKSMHDIFKQDKVLVGIGARFLLKTDKENKEESKYNMYLRNRIFLRNKLKINQVYGEAFMFRENLDLKRFTDYINTKNLIIINRRNPEIKELPIGRQKYIIEAPASNAYSEYNKIFQEIKETIVKNNLKKEDTLALIAIGVASEPLVMDINKLGYIAWDVGGLFQKFILDGWKEFLNKNV